MSEISGKPPSGRPKTDLQYSLGLCHLIKIFFTCVFDGWLG